MAKDRKAEVLKSVALFSQCSAKELKEIAGHTTMVALEAGEVLTKEGKPGNEFFVIVEGEADVKLRGRRLSRLGPGSFFGEMSLLDRQPRAATVTARTPMKVYVVTPNDFALILDKCPSVARSILRVLAQRLRVAEKKLVL